MNSHTFAKIEVSAFAFEEIWAKLLAAGYQHAFVDENTIDMHGLALVLEPDPEGDDAA